MDLDISKGYLELTPEIIELISPREANHFSIIPKSFSENKISFYCCESNYNDNEEKFKEVKLLLDREVDFFPISDHIIKLTLARYYRDNNTIIESRIKNDYVDELIYNARRVDASDIHIEIYNNQARVRFRLDGHLIEKGTIEILDYPEIINQIKIKSKLNITEKRLPQDGRIEYENFDVRVSILPTHYGEGIVMRILGKDASHLSLSSLGFNENELRLYKENISKPNGIILISGPTGSGKTTTLYATLKSLNTIDKKIVTVEDPIEYTLKGVNQVQLREDIGLDFTAALKSFLRQDPDIIMLGEIRDANTAQMAIRASLTGHLVFSTIHTNSSLGTIARLVDMGIPPFLIAETLNMSIAQRLVRTLCDNCKEKIELEKKEVPNHFFLDTNMDGTFLAYKANGCDVCYFSGYTGREAIFEILPMTSGLSRVIKNKEGLSSSLFKSTKSLSQKAFEMLINGSSSLEEVYPLLINN